MCFSPSLSLPYKETQMPPQTQNPKPKQAKVSSQILSSVTFSGKTFTKFPCQNPSMAQQHQLMTTAVVVFFLIISTASVSSARLLDGFLSHGLQAATEPTLNLALPLDGSDDVVVTTTSQEKDPNQQQQQQVLPCNHMVTIKKSHTGTLMRSPRLAGKYGPMILSMLPREPVPTSGPSKGTNDIKN